MHQRVLERNPRQYPHFLQFDFQLCLVICWIHHSYLWNMNYAALHIFVNLLQYFCIQKKLSITRNYCLYSRQYLAAIGYMWRCRLRVPAESISYTAAISCKRNQEPLEVTPFIGNISPHVYRSRQSCISHRFARRGRLLWNQLQIH